MSQDDREKRDLHALTEEGMVLCNPRDKEAAHRAQMEGIATDDEAAVTCRKCLSLLYMLRRERRDQWSGPASEAVEDVGRGSTRRSRRSSAFPNGSRRRETASPTPPRPSSA